MVQMPVRLPLKGSRRPDQRSFVMPRNLKADRHAVITEATRQGHRRMSGQIERCSVALQSRNELRLATETAHRIKRTRPEWLYRHEQQLNCAKQMREAAAEVHTAQAKRLVVDRRY